MHYDANYAVDRRQPEPTLRTWRSCTGTRSAARRNTPSRPSRSTVERQPRGFRVKRRHMNADVPPFHRKVIAQRRTQVDRWNVGTHAHAGRLLPRVGVRAGGLGHRARRHRQARGSTATASSSPGDVQARTHFFWNYLHNWNLRRLRPSRCRCTTAWSRASIEDKAIIEASSRLFDADPGFRMHPIAADAPLAHFRRVLAQLIAQERAAALAA